MKGVTFLEYRIQTAAKNLKKVMNSIIDQNNEILRQLEAYLNSFNTESFQKKIDELGASRCLTGTCQPAALGQHINGRRFARIRATREGHLRAAVRWELRNFSGTDQEARALEHRRNGSQIQSIRSARSTSKSSS